jgi:hypothetical protein
MIATDSDSPLTTPNLRVILYEGNGSRPLDKQYRRELISTLLKAGFPVSRVTPNTGEVSPSDDSPLMILGDFEDPDIPHSTISGSKAQIVRTLPIRFFSMCRIFEKKPPLESLKTGCHGFLSSTTIVAQTVCSA